MTEDDFRALCLSLPETVEGANMGSIYFKANGKDLARLLGGGRAMLTGVPVEEVEMLTEAEPDVFWADGHFKQARCVVATLERLEPDVVRGFLERRFRQVAKKSVLKAWEG
ncbi:MmcQ/YjbR family DNA-binding protein [Phenylobacterium sp. VNQ135]|uniref:MmcQ/YjbR family DNA-binding protein n=1 Tax=Phenylobacterium sp. VNQ135 TaxID=3400922 RepID=UPI003C0C9BCF